MTTFFDNDDIGKLSKLCALLTLAALFALLVGRFWWYGGTTSWAGAIRLPLLTVLLIAVVFWREALVFFKGNIYAVLVGAFLFYLAVNSIALGEGKAARRVLLLGAFFVGMAFVIAYARVSQKKLMGVMVVTSAVVAVITIVTLSRQGVLNFAYRQGSISNSGISDFADFENSILAGLQMGFSAVTALWLLFQARSLAFKLCWTLCVAITLAYIYLTYGRTAWLATVASSGIILLWMAERRWRIRMLVVGFVLGGVILFLFNERIAYEIFERKLTYRDEIWTMVLELMPGHWIFGYGADASVAELLGPRPLGGGEPILIAHAHSIYMEVLFNYGVVGLGFLLVVILASFWQLHSRRDQPIAILGLAVLFGGTLGMAFDFSSFVSTPNLLWLWFWLPVAWALVLSGNGSGHGAAMINDHCSARSAT